MKRYIARDLLNTLDEDQIWALPNEEIVLVFDDGEEFITRGRETIFSYYLWDYHRKFPQMPLLKKHHIPRKRLDGDTHLNVGGVCYWDCFDITGTDIETLSLMFYALTNRIYNVFTARLGAYVTSIDILDFLDVVDHPKIAEIVKNMRPTEDSIEHAYAAARPLLRDPAQIPDSQVVRSAASNLVSMGQVLQVTICRGFLTDVDSTINPNPVMGSFTEGIHSLFGSMMESRSAAKSLSFAKEPLQAVEYFDRKVQLGCAALHTLWRGDCGSRTYRPWLVRPQDVKCLAGIYRLVDGVEVPFRATDTALIGTVVKLRLPFDCNHPGGGVCSRCFGQMADSLPDDSNPGHFSGTTLCEDGAQKVISIKHLDGTAAVEDVEITDGSINFIAPGCLPSTIVKADTLVGRRCELIIDARSAKSLTDITLKDIDGLQAAAISELAAVIFRVWDRNNTYSDAVVPLTFGSRKSFLSSDLLKHMLKVGWSLTDVRGDYLVDITDFPVDHILFQLPMRQINMVDYMAGLERFYKGANRTRKGSAMKTVLDFDDPVGALVYFHDLVETKLSVNIAHLALMLKAAMVVSRKPRDYHIPGDGVVGEFGVYAENMTWGSLGGKMAFQGHHDVFTEMESYTVDYRRFHPLDPILHTAG